MKKITLLLMGISVVASAGLTRDIKGVVTDSSTKLQWQDNYDDNDGVVKKEKWQEALNYCESLTLDGGHWRLPNLNELYSIVDFTRSNPAIDPLFQYIQDDTYWSSTASAGGEWYISFGSGYSSTLSGYEENIRCVRSANMKAPITNPNPTPIINHDGFYKVSTKYLGGSLSSRQCMGDIATIGIEVKGTNILDMSNGMIIQRGDLKLNQNTISGTLKDGTIWNGTIDSTHKMSGTYNYKNGGCTGTFQGVIQP